MKLINLITIFLLICIIQGIFVKQKKQQLNLTQQLNSTNSDVNYDLQDVEGLVKTKPLSQVTMNLNELTPSYKLLVDHQVREKIEGTVDYSKLEIVEFDIDINQKTLLIPSGNYQTGQGFDVQSQEARGSPFIAELIDLAISKGNSRSGKIKVSVITSASQMADELTASASLYGSGWGVSASASFSMNKQSNMKANQVIVQATHTTKLPPSTISQSSLMLSQNARKTLATDKFAFNKEYGTHFFIGEKRGCTMDIQMKKTVKSTEDKLKVAAGLKASYSGMVKVGGEVNIGVGKSNSQFDSDTEISILYTGMNNNVFLEGLEISDLQKAILQFPKNCLGSQLEMILYPYEKSSSYLDVLEEVKQTNIQKQRQIYYESLKEQKLTPLQLVVKKQNYMKDVDIERIKNKVQFETNLKINNKFTLIEELMHSIFIKATILNQLFLQGIQDDQSSSIDLKKQNDQMFALKVQNIKIIELSEKFFSKLRMVIEEDDMKNALLLIDEGRKDIDQLFVDDLKLKNEREKNFQNEQSIAEAELEAERLRVLAQKQMELERINTRYVYLRASGQHDHYIQLANVQVYYKDENNHEQEVAANKPVNAKTAFDSNGSPHKANINNAKSRDSDYYHSAGYSSKEYWRVDLVQSYIISKVTIRNRNKQSMWFRSKDMKLLFYNQKMELISERKLLGDKELEVFTFSYD